MLGLEPGHGLPLVDDVLHVARRVARWDAARCATEVSAYHAYVQRFSVSDTDQPAAGAYNLAHEHRH